MKIKHSVIAFILALIFLGLGVCIFYYSSSVYTGYLNDLPEERNGLRMPDPYNREAAEETLRELLNSFFIFNLPLIWTLIGGVIIFLSIVCFWLGFVFRQLNRRIEELEKKSQ